MKKIISRNIDMCNGPLFGKIIMFTIPLMLTGVLQLFYNAMDIIVVGRFAGKEAVAAVGSTGSLINLIINVFMGISVGVNVVVANAIGARKFDDVSKAVHTAAALGVFCGVAVGIFGFCVSASVLRLMSTPEDVLPLATLYTKIYFLGTPANILYNFLSAVLRAQGDTRRPLYILGISGVVNVVLNLIFVIVFKMDVAGVAVATIVSQYLSAVMVSYILIKSHDYCKIRIRQVKIHKSALKKIVRIGLPSGLSGTVFSLSNTVIQSSINSFNSTALVAGNSAAANIEGFVYILMNSFYHTTISFVGQNKGAKKYDRIGKSVRICALTGMAVGLLTGVSVRIFAHLLLRIYLPGEEEAIYYGIIRLTYICMPYFLCGIMEVAQGGLRGMGSVIAPMCISLIGACGLRLVWVYTVFKAFRSFEVLLCSYAVTWSVTAICLFIAYSIVKNRLKKRDLAEA